MCGHPRTARPEHNPISTTPKANREFHEPERVSSSRYAKPNVLMGEVVGPNPKLFASGGAEIGLKRDAFRAFMIARHLQPSAWAKAAGIPSGEIMAFLTGHARAVAPQSLAKLAHAAGCEIEEMFLATAK